MSDEAAFLEVLKANPADDTARLVYADWLDEHDEPQKAEYLRLVVEIAGAGSDVTLHPHRSRVAALAAAFTANWRFTTGSRFSLVLDRMSDSVKTIKWFREITGEGLGVAKTACEMAPHPIYVCVPFESAFSAYNLHPTGSCGVRIAPSPKHAESGGARYQLILRAHLTEAAGQQAEHECHEALTRFFTDWGVLVTGEVLQAALSESGIVLPDGLSADHVRASAGEFMRYHLRRPHPSPWLLRFGYIPLAQQ